MPNHQLCANHLYTEVKDVKLHLKDAEQKLPERKLKCLSSAILTIPSSELLLRVGLR